MTAAELPRYTVRKDHANDVFQVLEGDVVVAVFERRRDAEASASAMEHERVAAVPEDEGVTPTNT